MSIFTEEKIYWIGPRESDIQAVSHLFAGSITIFGSNEGTNIAASAKYPQRIDHNNPVQSKESDEFMVKKVREYLEQDPNAKFVFYNANIYNSVSGFQEINKQYNCFYCLNDAELLRDMNDKHNFHTWFMGRYNVLKIIERNRVNCKYDAIKRELNAPDGSRFIIQAPVASGGAGTFIMSRDNELAIAGPNSTRLEHDKDYLVSVYQENNVSVNIHAIIYDKDILLTPGSVQIMKEDDLRLMYRGGDFIAYRQIEESKRKTFEEMAMGACHTFQEMGYRGVCGIDAIITKDEVILLEVNDRFQASTNILNKGLIENGFKSIQELNMDAFCKNKPSEKDKGIKDAVINYSEFSFIYSAANCVHPDHVLSVARQHPLVSGINLDGYVQGLSSYTACAHLFRINFRTNIVWLNEEHTLNIHENIADPTDDWMRSIQHFRDSLDDRLALKVALLTQGVVITPQAAVFLQNNGGCRPATNNAMDLKIDIDETRLVVNAPIAIKFCEFTPFSLRVGQTDGEECLQLYYYDDYLTDVGYFKEDKRQYMVTQNGVPFSKVAYLSTDRLRVHLTNNCRFKTQGDGCKFCNMPLDEDCQPITAEDVEEVVSYYYKNCNALHHYLIGGQSADDDIAADKLVETADIINRIDRSDKKYAMILPCGREVIDRLRDVGVSQFAFNIEIYDEELARKYMPGKGSIPRSDYLNDLRHAAMTQEHVGDTRSLLVVGLEPFDSLLECIKLLANNKIQPILSIFRPLPETPLADAIPPAMDRLCRLYREATAICQAADPDLYLGPDCTNCQNNTLALPY